ncbi:DUF3152 domain-containing protein [Streptomyces sp. TS71-3]|uniref:DUF3152 domain-containing protein n=1 Tax=Streptomyces sp. TS71-3 TaxID=2733862 RepID=UPI001B2751BA|nr:DUF3152 domain-containing protein [Streptomyces sp. TS71-3]GHJ37743.1 hypothetical protein Sm713_33520 [Streptomyces sp. TS71-3]
MVQQKGSPSRDRGDDAGRPVGRIMRRPRRLFLGVLLLAVLIVASAVVSHRFGAASTTSYATSPASGQGATPTAVPSGGPGTFVTARATGEKVGQGPNPLRYMVQIEKGIDISAEQTAKEIAGILADPRGWTANGYSAFQLVSSGPYDLKVRIATPGTTDTLCWEGIHEDTEGEYDCEVLGGLVVNLKRWIDGSPTFDGPIHDYRALIINHEMGHFLGHQHQTCPGPGRPAPVMMQQIKGLHGCVANAWPYDRGGHYLSGPPAA